MPKRPFERRDGTLTDHFEDPPGQKCTYETSAYMLGERLDAMSRAANLAKIASGGPGTHSAISALGAERSPELLEALLKSIELGDIAAPMGLLQFLDDPRVRTAIVKAARTQEARHLANFAQVLGLIGGTGALDVLSERLAELASHPRLMADDAFFNYIAGSACSVTDSLLRLSAEQLGAAHLLVRLFEHPCSFNRATAVRIAASRFEPELKTEAQLALRGALLPLMDSPSPKLFLIAAPVLWWTDRPRAFARWEALLRDANLDLRESALSALSHLRNEPAGWAAVVRWLPNETSVRLAIHMATYLGELVPEVIARELAVRGLEHESPSLRVDVLDVLKTLPSDTRQELARAAAESEPDPALKAQLEKIARGELR